MPEVLCARFIIVDLVFEVPASPVAAVNAGDVWPAALANGRWEIDAVIEGTTEKMAHAE
jgi:hypothetical protein